MKINFKVSRNVFINLVSNPKLRHVYHQRPFKKLEPLSSRYQVSLHALILHVTKVAVDGVDSLFLGSEVNLVLVRLRDGALACAGVGRADATRASAASRRGVLFGSVVACTLSGRAGAA